MINPDIVNAIFETFGGAAVAFNVKAILRDKKTAGFSLVPLYFFTSWGYWNMFFYPHLNQWYSAAGAGFTVAANTLYITLVIYYRTKENKKQRAFTTS